MKTKYVIRMAAFCIIFIFITASCKKESDGELSLTSLDNAIKNEMNQYNIPALSVAIVKNEKLVYIKSYGFSDKESRIPAADDDLYRIASVSKPITVIAILKLVQDSLLSLDQKDLTFNKDFTYSVLGISYDVPGKELWQLNIIINK